MLRRSGPGRARGAGRPALLLPKTPSMLVGAVARARANVVRDSARAIGKRCGMVMDRAAATGYLGMTNVFALLRLLPVSNRDKDAEILALRHQLLVLQRQLGPDRARFTPADRALLAALLHQLPRDVLKRLNLVVRPDTVLRWHRDLVAQARPAVPAPVHGPPAHPALDPCPGTATGPREPRVGVPPGTRRTAGARGEGRRFHRLGDPPARPGSTPLPSAAPRRGLVSCAPRLRSYWRVTSSRR
jgi:hypothetical protein